MDQFAYCDDDLLPWAASHLQIAGFRDDAVSIGRRVGADIRGVAVFDTFGSSDCMLHLASDGKPGWMTRDFIRLVMTYPFIQCRFARITSEVSSLNIASLKLTRHFGWVEEGRRRNAGQDGEDTVLFGMLRRECRWLFV